MQTYRFISRDLSKKKTKNNQTRKELILSALLVFDPQQLQKLQKLQKQ